MAIKMFTSRATEMYMWVVEVKPKADALHHSKDKVWWQTFRII